MFEPESVMESSKSSKSNGATKKVTEQFREQVIHEKSPSNADIFAYLKKMDRKIVNIEFKLKTLDSLEEKVSTFDREVVKFTHFKDREIVKKERIKLRGTSYYIHEQFPPEIVKKRRRLVPKLKAAQNEGHTAWISYDTLYIDGKAQRDA